ncbi:hypothetical protein JCM24511_02440 [Saitozyma sp. JCM 24511]|nr:hypothetical protein JCM24511_02440 [Saitozyma sp. JCM 24511]
MLALRHFVPLQTLLLAIYARLFSLASHLLDVLGSEVIKFQVSPAKLAITSAPSVMTEAPEIGERVERTVTPLPTTPVTQSIATQESLTQAPTEPRLERQVTRIQATTQKKKKQKKTSAIDDIFGL